MEDPAIEQEITNVHTVEVEERVLLSFTDLATTNIRVVLTELDVLHR